MAASTMAPSICRRRDCLAAEAAACSTRSSSASGRGSAPRLARACPRAAGRGSPTRPCSAAPSSMLADCRISAASASSVRASSRCSSVTARCDCSRANRCARSRLWPRLGDIGIDLSSLRKGLRHQLLPDAVPTALAAPVGSAHRPNAPSSMARQAHPLTSAGSLADGRRLDTPGAGKKLCSRSLSRRAQIPLSRPAGRYKCSATRRGRTGPRRAPNWEVAAMAKDEPAARRQARLRRCRRSRRRASWPRPCRTCSATTGQTVVVKYGGHAMGDAGAGGRLRPGHRAPQAGRREPDRRARRRPADRRHAEAPAAQERVRARPARHRQADRRGGRDGAGRPHQQGHRHRHQPAGRQGGRHLRQGRQPDDRAQDHGDAGPRVEPDAGGRHRLRRRSRRGQPAHRRGDRRAPT